ncbi:MAG: V-type ATP synthase subunit A [Candidatus Raymondbacteria bacterium RifOxyA12_full_50_37]|uniref:V-type ATP synthase subunit A n=1 Tax=Candidatus Raymondbacteria bacterium RIFOXYD12_FULL_49_13 TaxID=1817890 RepID=A0A1F7FAP8_UNCRA|nr:MAG: V-type ATP synthase subunit A [Candidatus Raymondbacteria bacterium RifOxyA12_full_50_37]OGJ92622.1 MAG: V-type ATP synthase subunit A [Candidatus Raymondbacteria bacterium RIFOXYA2_FULL_49_16]OGJ97976.1 MAG: V-type ATP synthase subunit A [Candidatus Raymondbacteria bacterium RIFOXYC2_FULL_50_21]OGK00118.1 MAG: V-type ATP synthase subunit A [Candidatus Raymondbacteria bacterium RifOxyB12_full_50_8]OGK03754.1 MAG: V-type ATP synthase subunit A [Candidatus Raymondbacteria bacterium RIFOXY
MSTRGKVTGIVANLVTIEVDGPVGQNEICYIDYLGTKLMAEVIKIGGKNAYVQVFESTRGLFVGCTAEFTGHMLEVTLGPGMLSRNYDGLQNNLNTMDGTFLQRGQYTAALDDTTLWEFKPLAKVNDIVQSADWLGEVTEGWINHKVMVPFTFAGTGTIKSIAPAGTYKVHDTIAVVTDSEGVERKLDMTMKWPVKIEVRTYENKPRPFKIFETGIRCIDAINPMVEGGTGFIPGPFGCGKTVLQHLLAKHAEADLIIVVACGERANEVVEIFTEFPELDDPRTGRKLMERTIIICNTSNMPVAAREASVYTGMTIAEYYRAMGLKILLLADSTSRWAQALREMSNRMEELPGPDAFPMDLPAIISNFYSRAGYVNLRNGTTGSITFIGTVSPAGGNLKEPVTESTKKAARAFYALAQSRADSKRYPAIDPIDSYSKYLEYAEVVEYFDKALEKGWVDKVLKMKDMLLRGKEARDQINILGDDGVPVEYHITFNKAEIIDFIILQQDAFDTIDQSTSLDRQRYMVNKVLDIGATAFAFDNFDEISAYFKKVINLLKQMNYQEYKSETFGSFEKELEKLLSERRKAA